MNDIPLFTGLTLVAVALVLLRAVPRVLRPRVSRSARARAEGGVPPEITKADFAARLRKAQWLRVAGSASNGSGYALTFVGLGLSMQLSFLVGAALGALVFVFTGMVVKSVEQRTMRNSEGPEPAHTPASASNAVPTKPGDAVAAEPGNVLATPNERP